MIRSDISFGPYCTNCGNLRSEIDCKCSKHDGGPHCEWCGFNPCQKRPWCSNMTDKEFDDATKRHDGTLDFAESHPRSAITTTRKETCPRCGGMSVGKIPHCPQCDNKGYVMHTVPGPGIYDADYFLRGRETGKSLYEDYRWLPDLTRPMVASMVSHLGIQPEDVVLDFGCARGYSVRAFRELGYNAWGYDVSRWALENADEVARPYLICNESAMLKDGFDWVIAKDVLEHIYDTSEVVDRLKDYARKGVFAVVPLGHKCPMFQYDILEYERDVTHIHRRPLTWWTSHFYQAGWSVEARYQVLGIKDNYSQYPTGNGFIVARRL